MMLHCLLPCDALSAWLAALLLPTCQVPRRAEWLCCRSSLHSCETSCRCKSKQIQLSASLARLYQPITARFLRQMTLPNGITCMTTGHISSTPVMSSFLLYHLSAHGLALSYYVPGPNQTTPAWLAVQQCCCCFAPDHLSERSQHWLLVHC
jgi:hypothetical protein